MQDSARQISRLSENREVTSQIGFSNERAPVIFQSEPLRRAFNGADQDEFFIFAWLAQVLNVGARQSVPAHNSIARRTGPSALNSECAHAATQCQLSANHRGQCPLEAMIFGALDLNRGAGPVCIRGHRENGVDKPLGSRASQQIVTPAQIEIARKISTAGAMASEVPSMQPTISVFRRALPSDLWRSGVRP